MAERETKQISTPAGHTVVVKTYLTARETDGVLRELFKDQEATEGKPKVSLVMGLDRNINLVKAALVSIDGVTENAFDTLQDLPASEYAFVLKEVQTLTNGNF